MWGELVPLWWGEVRCVALARLIVQNQNPNLPRPSVFLWRRFYRYDTLTSVQRYGIRHMARSQLAVRIIRTEVPRVPRYVFLLRRLYRYATVTSVRRYGINHMVKSVPLDWCYSSIPVKASPHTQCRSDIINRRATVQDSLLDPCDNQFGFKFTTQERTKETDLSVGAGWPEDAGQVTNIVDYFYPLAGPSL